ncbi:MAG: hypothetical protein GX610_01300, partial [Rhodococcus sp.]|nr:hypothetical protein [Rhodococcus sp. (in: high G+C Gram-positive bacteria)]
MAIHPRVSVNPMTTFSLAFEDTIAVWREIGAHTVGVNVMHLDAQGWDRSIELLLGARQGDAPLRVEYLNYGISSAVTDDAGWSETEAVLLRAVEAAHRLEAPTFYFCTGPPGSLRWEDAVDLLGDRLSRVIAAARDA